MGIRAKIGNGIGAPLWILIQLGGLVFHVWTIIIAFAYSGLVAAVFTSILPPISELFWIVKIGSRYGFNHQYCVVGFVLVGMLVLVILIGLLASKDEDFR